MEVAASNTGFVECWNTILTPKWLRFRHLLSGNGKMHSDLASRLFAISRGERVLDIGCGFGETCLEIGQLVGAQGEVLGIDCTESFLEVANRERDAAGLSHVQFVLGDAQVHPLPVEHFAVAFSRFGVMFFESAVRALRNAHRALEPGGRVCLIVWRSLHDNPCWGLAKQVALRHLPPPGEAAQTCGPGPFSMANEETDREMLAAAGFTKDVVFQRIDVDVCVGRDLEEAIDYQILVGPSGEIVREAGAEGQEKLPIIRRELADMFEPYRREHGIFMPSSSWAIVARKSS